MPYGKPYASGYGNPENHMEYAIGDSAEFVVRGYTSMPYRFKLRSGQGDRMVQVYVNGGVFRTLSMVDGEERVLDIVPPYGSNSISVIPLSIGRLQDPTYSCSPAARYFETTDGKRVTLSLDFKPKIVEPERNSGSHTSSWVLTGLVYGQNTILVSGHPSWGRINYTIVVSGGTATLTLKTGDLEVASGSALVASLPGSLTISESNNSGLSGSVTVAATVADVTDGILDVRWPKEMKILRDTTDPPSTVVATIPFRGKTPIRWTEGSELPAGTYYYRRTPVSDTGTDGTTSASVTQVVPGPPAAPTSLAYSSGDATALVLSYNRSSTAGATYSLYGTTAIGTPLDLNTPIATALAGTPSGATTISAGAVTGYAGKAYYVLRATSGGTEEKNLALLEVEFDGSGVRVAPRPNVPGGSLETITITSGRSMVARGIYNPVREKATATTLQLYTRAYPSGSYGGSPDATAALSATVQGLKGANLSHTFSSNGYYAIKIVAATAGSVLSPIAESEELLVLATNETLPDGDLFSAELSRS